MNNVLKLVLFGLFVYVMILCFYRTYRLLNDKITGSQTLFQVIGYALLLILTNLLLFGVGTFLFLQVYAFLTLPG
jgi:hypothetical protein